MKVFTVSSKHNYVAVSEVRNALVSAGYGVILPNCFDDPGAEARTQALGPEEHLRFKQRMFGLQIEKVKTCDAVLVLNSFTKNGIENYIGGGTFLEIYEAWRQKKAIFLMCPVPRCLFTDELLGLGPMVLDNSIPRLLSELDKLAIKRRMEDVEMYSRLRLPEP